MFKAKFIMEQLCGISKIPTHVFEQSGAIAEVYGISKESDPFYGDERLFSMLVQSGNGEPMLHMKEDGILYGSFRTSDGYYIIWGPISLTLLSFQEQHNYCARYHIKNKDYQMFYCSMEDMMHTIKLAYAVLEKKEIHDDGIFFKNSLEEDVKALSEYDMDRLQLEWINEEQGHITYREEQEFLMEIETGGQYVYTPQREEGQDPIRSVGKLAENNFKQIEYMTATSIVLATRAAIRGGLSVSQAYSMGELYLQKLAKCKNAMEFMQIHGMMRTDFIERVRESKEKKKNKDYVEQCKEYIAQNIRHNIKVETIAREIAVNENYLSRKFSQREGISITGYIIKKKMELAANMLKYSDYKISEIATYFSFSSQSRFGEQFRREYGMSPLEFRRKEKVIDFQN